MEKFFDGFEVRYDPHLDKCDTNNLEWIASSRAPTPPDVNIEKLTKPSIRLVEEAIDATKPDLMVIDEPEQELAYDWMIPTKLFLDIHPQSDDNVEVERIARKSKMYHPIDGILCMMMKCISREEGIQLLQDIHSGAYGPHSSWCSIIGKAFKHGFYLPTAKDDTMEVITKCKNC
jgi:hypothetical protein